MAKKKIIDLSSYSQHNVPLLTRESSKYSAFIEQEEIATASTNTTNKASTEAPNESETSQQEAKTKSINMAFTETNYSISSRRRITRSFTIVQCVMVSQ